ncbi:hypothetical protein [Halobaculum magnesiiphilum]|uniref:Uncharacterized protein n=1 Tax=Halobaculum magnesiiphilum TaxID=1017351 RepID=A0A8T8WBF1_9EURY|nr:hypothetical protein [Halobaculum magnesiiphilum]QZP37083.1 hypothetical protein K6T50_12395 [Halobaculum magnesiiphilum]
MGYETNSYQIDVPSDLWDAFHRIHDDRDRINAPIVELIAEDVDEQLPPDADPGVEETINRIRGGTDGA